MDPYPASFFDRPTETVARALLGDRLVYEHPQAGRLVGRIVETEAYTEDDPACHASHLTRDPDTGAVAGQGRGADLFAPPGTAYVYLIYGMHWLLNVVTEPEGTAGAVLIRAVEPEAGIEFMDDARGVQRTVDLTNGPGKLTEAFDVGEAFHRMDLTAPPLYFAEGQSVPEADVAQSSRIGISKAVERPWRWFVAENRFVSRGTPSDQQ
jgi:DNA-3-methyladenine glycosylase